MSAVIDLTLPRLFRYSVLRSGEVEATDDLTFDPDPESLWHCRGYGRTEPEALADLLDQLAEAENVPHR
jgi:MOSC domain-containing protein YiiM